MERQSIIGSAWLAGFVGILIDSVDLAATATPTLFKADESAQASTGPYRQLHADDINEREQSHEHTIAALPRAPEPAVRVSRDGGGH